MYNRKYYRTRKRVRDKRYTDYGISKEELIKIRDFCLQCDIVTATKIRVICNNVNENIGELLYESITKGLSYEKLDGRYGVPYSKLDFYAYRRKALAQINELRKG